MLKYLEYAVTRIEHWEINAPVLKSKEVQVGCLNRKNPDKGSIVNVLHLCPSKSRSNDIFFTTLRIRSPYLQEK